MKNSKRISAVIVAAVLALSPSLEARAAADAPVCDETLYITLDPYGEIKESSVVKSYTMNGSSQIVDYGTYDAVKNMTDHAEPVTAADGKLTFTLEKPADRFYFEGSTNTSREQLPWDIRVSYRLNGLEKKAEELYGASGLIEVNVDLLPNTKVSEYYRNNMVLMAGTMVDMDKNLSLEAEGAQIQALGNINAVVFFALPGEEQHYSIRIGSDDFSFSGLIFTMVPLKAAQLDKVGDLREAKTTLQDSADAVNDSLDVLLDTFDGMRKSVADTADGLRGLDHSRQLFADSKGKVYDDADAALEGLEKLSRQFEPFSEHMDEAGKFLDTMNSHVNELTGHLDDLSPDLEDMKDTLRELRDDVQKINAALNSPQADLGAQEFVKLLEKTKADLEVFKQSQAALDGGVSALAPALAGLIASAGGLGGKKAELFNSEDLESLLEEMADAGVDMGDEDEVASYLRNEVGLATDEIDALLSLASSSLYETATPSVPDKGNISAAVGAIVSGFHGTAGNTGLAGDIQAMITQAEVLLQTLASQKATATAALHETADMAHVAANMCNTLDDIISDVDDLTNTMNYYHDDTIRTLKDLGKMTDSAAEGIHSLAAFCTSFENQLRLVGDSLNSSTQKTLNGLAGTLDGMGAGLDQTEVLKDAKDTIKTLIEDKWDEYTTEDTTILNADAEAQPLSLTSEKNPSPRTIQIVLRTGEIKEQEESVSANVDESFHPEGNVFHRIASIFKRIWEMVTSVFHK